MPDELNHQCTAAQMTGSARHRLWHPLTSALDVATRLLPACGSCCCDRCCVETRGVMAVGAVLLCCCCCCCWLTGCVGGYELLLCAPGCQCVSGGVTRSPSHDHHSHRTTRSRYSSRISAHDWHRIVTAHRIRTKYDAPHHHCYCERVLWNPQTR